MNTRQFQSWLHNSRHSPLIMGILNLTPDSFSGDGLFMDVDKAVKHALILEKDGADIIDIGGESTRPGSESIDIQEELERVLPVIENLREQTEMLISIDTYKAQVADQAIKAGADIINDISGLMFDKQMAAISVKHNAWVVIMHIKGTPKDMQVNPVYEDLIKELKEYFITRINYAVAMGISREKIIVDPGIGFGKKWRDNFILIRELSVFKELGLPILVGPSKKSFIGMALDLPVDDRLEGTAAAVTASVLNGADIIRVHDVKAMSRVIKISEMIKGNRS
ncbi:MAG: dihydropteroate synthase [Candidatus Neomarinimicrobiota bacterium]